jgi:ethanolamine utilization cobalamin adenosyltransferase
MGNLDNEIDNPEIYGFDRKIARFFDTRAKTWYWEAAKHLVPSYTTSRMIETGNKLKTAVGIIVDVSLLFDYAELGKYLISKI